MICPQLDDEPAPERWVTLTGPELGKGETGASVAGAGAAAGAGITAEEADGTTDGYGAAVEPGPAGIKGVGAKPFWPRSARNAMGSAGDVGAFAVKTPWES